MAPKVSVLSCSFNRPELLREAVQSMRDQTDPDWEHLIYDDASTTPGVREALLWAAEDPRVRVWTDNINHDQPAALWNFLADRSYGRYLTVLDDDNMKLPRFVEVMAGELDADPALGIVTCGWRVDRPGDDPTEYFLNLSTSAEKLATMSTCDGGAMLYRRSLFEQVGYFSEEYRTSEDWDWLRHAVHVTKVKNLHEALSTYRSHAGSRMYYAEKLGVHGDMAHLKLKPIATEITTSIKYPSFGRLTQSQVDVCQSIERAWSTIPWAPAGHDLCVIVSPFQMSNDEISGAISGYVRVLSLHMEDPYALGTNLDRVRNIAATEVETWVCTNDASCLPAYQEIVGGRVLVCPTLGADDQLPATPSERDIDVLICGYSYPSRKRFMHELLPKLNGLNVVFVGDEWNINNLVTGRINVSVHPTLPLDETYRMHARAKTVVCMHRINGDCGGGDPINVNRGAMEGYLGAQVFLDRSRPLHDFDENDVVWYEDPADLAEKLRAHFAHLAVGPSTYAERFAEKCRLNLTYRTRLARIINCVRSPRYLAELP